MTQCAENLLKVNRANKNNTQINLNSKYYGRNSRKNRSKSKMGSFH